VALLVFILWKDYYKERREDAKEDELIERLRKLEDYQKGVLTSMVAETTEALNKSNVLLEKLNNTYQRVLTKLEYLDAS
jgi:hypothetical protein